MSTYGFDAPEVTIYGPGQSGAVMLLVVAGIISILAILAVSINHFVFARQKTKSYQRTNIAAYLVSLLCANVFQAIATIMNARWATEGIVYDGGFCAFQGGLKNAANVGIALWSFMIALHVFNLLFLRWQTTQISMYATLIGGWSTVLMVVSLGPLFIATEERGPYFGVSGFWCWITENYPKEQTFLEYFFEFLSAGLGFVLYVFVLLRVRGNLTLADGRWSLHWIPRSEAWKLSLGRDLLDTAMLRVSANMVWYPVAYSCIIIPVALARLSSFTGHHVPFWATITTDVMFNLTGLVNSILLFTTRGVLPDTSTLPQFSTPRKGDGDERDSVLDMYEKPVEKFSAKLSVTPFVLPPVSPCRIDDVDNPFEDSAFERHDVPSSPGNVKILTVTKRSSGFASGRFGVRGEVIPVSAVAATGAAAEDSISRISVSPFASEESVTPLVR